MTQFSTLSTRQQLYLLMITYDNWFRDFIVNKTRTENLADQKEEISPRGTPKKLWKATLPKQ